MTDTFQDRPQDGAYTVADVRAIDAAAIDGGIGGYELMTRAAAFAVDVAREAFGAGRRWLVFCGAGNNAGDGYVLARLAAGAGIEVQVLTVADPATLKGDAATAHRDAVAAGISITAFDGRLVPEAADLLIDSLLGSGLDRPVAGEFARAVDAINGHPAPVFALDVPTGIDGDAGRELGVAVRADVTATFVARKTGLYLADGPECCGALRYSSLAVPESAFAGRRPRFCLPPAGLAAAALPPRRRAAHKGDFGHVVIVGGGPGMPGAARLAGEAALRAGAGRVSIAAHPESAAAIPAARPELMCHAVAGPADLEPLLEAATVVAIGPGLGQGDWSRALFAAARGAGQPMVVDADGLNLLAGEPDTRDARVLTPHPGEAGRLLGIAAADVQADRPAALVELARRYGGSIVLKGQHTLTSRRDAAPWLCTAGNPGMATAGMGDVLTGIVAGVLAQGLDGDTAAAVAVDVHARAADVAAAGGERGLLASDLVAELRPWVNP